MSCKWGVSLPTADWGKLHLAEEAQTAPTQLDQTEGLAGESTFGVSNLESKSHCFLLSQLLALPPPPLFRFLELKSAATRERDAPAGNRAVYLGL